LASLTTPVRRTEKSSFARTAVTSNVLMSQMRWAVSTRIFAGLSEEPVREYAIGKVLASLAMPFRWEEHEMVPE